MNFVLEVGDDVLFCRHPIVHHTITTKAGAIKEQLGDHYFCLGFYNTKEQVQATRQFNQTSGDFFDSFIAKFEEIFGLAKGSVLFGDWLQADMTKIFLLPLGER